MDNLNELSNFHKDCNKLLNEETFDTFMQKEMYKAYKEIISQGKSKYCTYCMYCDKINQKCINNLKLKLKVKSCYQARKIFLLKKAGLYGQPRNH